MWASRTQPPSQSPVTLSTGDWPQVQQKMAAAATATRLCCRAAWTHESSEALTGSSSMRGNGSCAVCFHLLRNSRYSIAITLIKRASWNTGHGPTLRFTQLQLLVSDSGKRAHVFLSCAPTLTPPLIHLALAGYRREGWQLNELCSKSSSFISR